MCKFSSPFVAVNCEQSIVTAGQLQAWRENSMYVNNAAVLQAPHSLAYTYTISCC